MAIPEDSFQNGGQRESSKPEPEKTRNCPFEKAGIFSHLFFTWMVPMFWKGYNRELEMKDLWDVPRSDESETLGHRLQRNFGRSKSLFRAVIRTFGWQILGFGIITFIEECIFLLTQPVLMMYLIRYFGGYGYSTLEGYLFASGVVLCSALYSFTHHQLFFGISHIAMKIRVACCTMIYRKSVKLSQAVLGETTVGQMVNLLSNDVNRFEQALFYVSYFWVGPIMTVMGCFILGYYLTWQAAIGGFAVLFLLIPLQSYMGRMFSRYRLKIAGKTDERVRLMNEILDAMRVIKMYAWEKPFAEKVDFARRAEIKIIRAVSYLRGFNMAMSFTSSRLILLATFAAYVTTGETMVAEKTFLAVSVFNNLRLVMTNFFPSAISYSAEALVSFKRLERFLLLSERVTPPEFFSNGPDKKNDTVDISLASVTPHVDTLRVDGICATWTPKGTEVLSDITFSVKPGELVAIIGMVGAGKSSLLQAILRELPLTKGNIECPRKIGYTSQEAWIFSGTIEENVLLGRPMDPRLFMRVVRACAFDKDLKQLPEGQRTLVGDRGVTLSGGQKARLSLARALYQQADLYLLDDPLSAVDPHVGSHLFDFCIMRYLKDKPRVLVTHQLQFLSKADKIIVLRNGGIRAAGTLEDLKKAGIDVNAFIAQEESPEEQTVRKNRRKRLVSTTSTISVDSVMSFGSYGTEGNQETLEPVAVPTAAQVAEIRTVGDLKWSTYWTFIRSGTSSFGLFIIILLNILSQLTFSGADYWLSYWTRVESEKKETEELSEEDYPWYERTNNAMYIYAGIVTALLVLSLSRSWGIMLACMNASVNLHAKMFNAVIRSPMKFFDDNPIGRTLNRFSRDTGNMDELLPSIGIDVIMIFLNIIGIVTVIAIVNTWILIPSAIVGMIFFYLRRFYLVTSRQVKRLEGISRSPVFSHLSTTLHGLATIRACRVEKDFCEKFDLLQDEHSNAWFLFISSTRWLGVCLDWLVVGYLACVTFSFMAFDSFGGEIGLAISNATMLTGMLQWGIRQSAELENQFTSVERIIEYSDLAPEADLESKPDMKPASTWPSEGAIDLRNVSLTYDANPDSRRVLKDLNVKINAKEKIGIVGRTGAGKSSFVAALFRLVEPFGSVTVDGIDTKYIGLHDLRQKLSIIPQEPVLFAGTVRKNLDPFSKYTDDQLWDALGQVQLKTAVSQLTGGLEGLVIDHGGNFSVGQRQLICLARAILNKNRILILDEATANVDLRTDRLIQTALRTKFVDCTTITVAHRLDTIIDSDRILVLDGGEVIQFGSANQLLQDKSGLFYKLVEQTGTKAFKRLFLRAAEAYKRKQREIMEATNNVLVDEDDLDALPLDYSIVDDDDSDEEVDHL
ncbi:unnamed protein product [Cyprideis torosa]|uniref:Uncharacterized protein n=1 Tax=Cyprideis torosa TaxID=163714 RepID=A0A7R8ZN04_9CRUS|nr:unnamed protein product [Cyprideis torosa]CAG0890313.1 unnamed protein product [Cyprideis torosa]